MKEKNKKVLTKIEQSLKEESSDRKKIMKEVNSNIDSYSYKLIEYENKIQKYELMEIKYHNLERELEEKTLMYQTIIDDLKKQVQAYEKDALNAKKEIVSFESKITALKSIVDLFIRDYGIDYVIKLSGLPESKIKEYLQK